MFWLIIIFLILLILEGFFSGSELAIVSIDLKRLKYEADKGKRGAKLALYFWERPDHCMSIISLGTNLCVISNTAFVTTYLINTLGKSSVILSIFLLPPILLIFGEIIPKDICRRYSNQISPYLAYGLRFFSIVFSPVVFLFSNFTKLICKGSFKKPSFFTREELKFLIKDDSEGIRLTSKERKLIERLFTFTETDVERAMIPLIEVVSIPEDAKVGAALEIFSRCHYSRLAVYRERVDNIIGIIHSFDFIDINDLNFSIKPFMHPVLFVPETKPVHILLKEMQQKRQALAVVVDEYGGAAGIVTVEDLLEEVMGEIIDEDEERLVFFRKIGDRRFLIKARMEIEQINEQLPFELPLGEYETLSGFILKYLGRIPRTGEKFNYDGLTFIIRKAQPTFIKEVEVIMENDK
ncbi:MAG: hypothetical protein AMJ45_03300 [Syntrophobacter sp. DG_60]|nr:MAG: hypothetical protein AMJ45_03300 [Syntrophobacter sp. DG_60]